MGVFWLTVFFWRLSLPQLFLCGFAPHCSLSGWHFQYNHIFPVSWITSARIMPASYDIPTPRCQANSSIEAFTPGAEKVSLPSRLLRYSAAFLLQDDAGHVCGGIHMRPHQLEHPHNTEQARTPSGQHTRTITHPGRREGWSKIRRKLLASTLVISRGGAGDPRRTKSPEASKSSRLGWVLNRENEAVLSSWVSLCLLEV